MTKLDSLKAAFLAPGNRPTVKSLSKALGVLSKKSVFDFGKYKGHVVKDIINVDPGYIVWLAENTKVTFTDKVLKKATEAAQRKRMSRHFGSGGASYRDDYDECWDDSFEAFCGDPWNVVGPFG